MKKFILSSVIGIGLIGCSSQQNKNPWHVICIDQASYVSQIPTGPFSDPAQAALALKTACGIFDPADNPSPAK